MRHETYEILQNDGITPVGNIMTSGLFVGGPTPPGPPIADQDMAMSAAQALFSAPEAKKAKSLAG